MEYQLIRSKRKTLAIEITREARLVVRAPLRCSQSRIEQFLAEKQAWITLHLQKMQQRRENHPEPTPEEEARLRKKARELLPGLVNRYAAQMDVQPTGITITGARTRFVAAGVFARGGQGCPRLSMLSPTQTTRSARPSAPSRMVSTLPPHSRPSAKT